MNKLKLLDKLEKKIYSKLRIKFPDLKDLEQRGWYDCLTEVINIIEKEKKSL